VTFIVLKSLAVAADAADEFAARLTEQVATGLGVVSSFVGRTLPGGINDGQIMWRAAFASEADYRVHARAVPASFPDAFCLDTVFYHLGRHATPYPDLRDGIWRALIVSVDAGTDRATRERFETEMVAMPRHVCTIRNWGFSRVAASQGARPWSYVWEQDFDSIEGMQGEYMMHPIHWGSIDRWYDVEHPDRIADGYLIHSACESATAQIR